MYGNQYKILSGYSKDHAIDQGLDKIECLTSLHKVSLEPKRMNMMNMSRISVVARWPTPKGFL